MNQHQRQGTTTSARSVAAQMLNTVPEVTVFFWIIKALCTTVGETAADYLNETLGLGIYLTAGLMTAALVVALVLQFRQRGYKPSVYWIAIVLISVVGTLITDILTDELGVSLVISTTVFVGLLGATFALWYRSERTLSIHSITTTRRAAFYWQAILWTFALGTAAGDLIAERFELGYLTAVVLFAAAIAVVAVAHYTLKLDAVLSFWLAYILTRPLGASIGDYLQTAKADGGLGLGTAGTSAAFLAAIVLLVTFLAVTRVDAPAAAVTAD